MEKNDFCRNCVHWNWHEQFCKKTQTYPIDIKICTMRELIVVSKLREDEI